jgi:uncharacterized protein YndB with AHSA1/START domain
VIDAIDTTSREMVITREFNAPRHLVFKAWIDPVQVAKWYGPSSFTNPECEVDARPGGSYRIVMRSPDGTDYPSVGTFLVVDAPERLVFTHGDNWHDYLHLPRPEDGRDPAMDVVTTVTFEDLGNRTRLTLHTIFGSETLRDAMINLGMEAGWSQSLDTLTEVLATA